MGLLAVCAAAAPSRDGATIVDSGSTNTSGFRMDVWSDGSATVTMQNRFGTAQSEAQNFTFDQKLAKKFFSDLKAARGGNATSLHCMKSASFGTSTHVTWHGWTSPDLDCPPAGPLTQALVDDINAIRQAGNIQTLPFHHVPLGPPRVIGSPEPSAT